jgi:predicted phosphate transport protein (TIGR00153 family)
VARRFRLIPREERFFTDLSAMADAIAEGAAVFEEILAADPPALARAGEVQAIEHRCDDLTHDIVERLNRTFVTPIDREDIHALADSLDDVMDAIDSAADSLSLYRIDRIRPEARQQAALIRRCVEQVRRALGGLERRDGARDAVIETKRLEHEADAVHRSAISRLFGEETDAITIIKWKEIFDFLEHAIDRCEKVAVVIEGVVVKHS